MQIRPFKNEDFDTVLDITIRAFTPIHQSFQGILGDKIFDLIYPDWKGGYKNYLSSLNDEEKQRFLVAHDQNAIIGYILYSINLEKKCGELGLNCVEPAHQNKGVGLALYHEVLSLMEQAGVELVEVVTGGDISHAPARRVYEKAGFTALPLVRYYKAL